MRLNLDFYYRPYIYTTRKDLISDIAVYNYAISDHLPIAFTRSVKQKQVKNSHDSTYRCYKSFDEDLFKADLVYSNLIFIESIADPNFALDILYDTTHSALSNHTTIKQKRIKHANFENYKKIRNKISSIIRKSKKFFKNDAIKNNKSSKFIWQNLNDITNNNKAHEFRIPNKLIINKKDIEGTLNSHFTNISNIIKRKPFAKEHFY
ncbi:hypothetical protein MAR_003162, partial [Mya arenaria]